MGLFYLDYLVLKNIYYSIYVIKSVNMANGKFININFVTIYGLIDYDNNLRYVGVTRKKPLYRFNNHIYIWS